MQHKPKHKPKKLIETISVTQSPHRARLRSHVPDENVLDLRSLVAKRQALSAQHRQYHQSSSHDQNQDHRHRRDTEEHSRLSSDRLPFHEWWSTLKKSSSSAARTHRAAPAPEPPRFIPRASVADAQRQHERVDAHRQPTHAVEEIAIEESRARDSLPPSPIRIIIRRTIVFGLLCVLFVLPAGVSAAYRQAAAMQTTLAHTAEEAFLQLQKGSDSLQGFNFSSAATEFTAASAAFDRAQDQIRTVNSVFLQIAHYIPGKGKTVASGVHLIRAGKELSEAGTQLAQTVDLLHSSDIAAAVQDPEVGVTGVLVVVDTGLTATSHHISAANREIQRVSLANVPAEKRDLVAQAQTMLPTMSESLKNAVATTDGLLTLLGHHEEKEYLVLFQNNHELRPTGGFIGSLALIDVSKGVVTGLDVPGGGVYDIAGQLRQQVISPEPLHLVNPHWNIQDANWFPHFPASAQKIQWFYERSGGKTVDGVITLVPSVVEQLLEITGPVDLTQDFGVVITAENFYDEVQKRAEEKFDVTRESKKIIGAVVPKLLNNVLASAQDPEQLLKILSVFQSELNKKNILLYLNDPALQNAFSQQGWTGELKQTDRDYLAVIHANIAGGKTDDVIENTINHHADIQDDGTIVDTVTISRVHTGPTNDELRNVHNVDYVRVYVPDGSALVSATGFQTPDQELFLKPSEGYSNDADLQDISGEIYTNEQTGVTTNNEFGKTIFGGWMQAPVGGSTTVTLRYRLPFTIDVGGIWHGADHYSLLVQKQPGSFGDILVSDVTIPDTMEVTHRLPPGYALSVQQVLDHDFFAGIVLEEQQ